MWYTICIVNKSGDEFTAKNPKTSFYQKFTRAKNMTTIAITNVKTYNNPEYDDNTLWVSEDDLYNMLKVNGAYDLTSTDVTAHYPKLVGDTDYYDREVYYTLDDAQWLRQFCLNDMARQDILENPGKYPLPDDVADWDNDELVNMEYDDIYYTIFYQTVYGYDDNRHMPLDMTKFVKLEIK